MGQSRKPGARTATVMTKLRPAEKLALRQNAEKMGVGMSTLIRIVLLRTAMGKDLAER